MKKKQESVLPYHIHASALQHYRSEFTAPVPSGLEYALR